MCVNRATSSERLFLPLSVEFFVLLFQGAPREPPEAQLSCGSLLTPYIASKLRLLTSCLHACLGQQVGDHVGGAQNVEGIPDGQPYQNLNEQVEGASRL